MHILNACTVKYRVYYTQLYNYWCLAACMSMRVYLYLCVVSKGNCISLCYRYLCGGVLFIPLYLRTHSYERLKANSIVNPELLREPKPSIRAGHIPHMQTNKLAHLPPIASTAQQHQSGCNLKECHRKWRFEKPLAAPKWKDKHI